MDMALFENMKVAAYLLWEQTKSDNTVKLWYCTEDIAKYLEESKAWDSDVISRLAYLDPEDVSYINFVRNIAFRIYVYTGISDSLANWFSAEEILKNSQWRNAIGAVAKNYSIMAPSGLKGIYSEQIRRHYEKKLSANQAD